MSENQQPAETTNFTYTTEEGVKFDVSLPGNLSDEEIVQWANQYGEETEIAAGSVS